MQPAAEPVIGSGFGLVEALGLAPGQMASLVGAGGKTTTLYALAAELRRRGRTVIVTTTTHLQTPRTSTTAPPLVVAADESDWRERLRRHLARYGSVTVVGRKIREDKLRGLETEEVESLRSLADCVVLEADGARGRSFKAPAAHEPVIPPSTDLTVVLCALDVLGMPLDESIVHRLEIVQALTGARRGEPLTEAVVARALAAGYLPRVPPRSRAVFFLNKADATRLEQAERLARHLLAEGAREVIFGEAILPNDCFYRLVAP